MSKDSEHTAQYCPLMKCLQTTYLCVFRDDVEDTRLLLRGDSYLLTLVEDPLELMLLHGWFLR